MTVHIEFDIDSGVLAALKKDHQAFSAELRLAAAVKWYELGLVSQGRAAEIAGLSRAEFLAALGRYGVSPFQQGDVNELVSDAREASGA